MQQPFIFDKKIVEDMAERISESYSNRDTRKGYKVGFILGVKDAKAGQMPDPEEIKVEKEDLHKYNSFWSSIFCASSGLLQYKFGYKDGYKDGYKTYLKNVKEFFEQEN